MIGTVKMSRKEYAGIIILQLNLVFRNEIIYITIKSLKENHMFNYPLYVTIDTNIFISCKFDFSKDSPLGLLLKYIQQGKIKLVLSDIVVRESENHIIKVGEKLYSLAKKIRKDALGISSTELINNIELNHILTKPDKIAIISKCKLQFEKFLNDSQAEIIKTQIMDLSEIIDDYFSFNPPFEDNNLKRKEFPDAIIASQIRTRFGEDDTVAIISNDNGFKMACKNTKNHLFYNSLGDLFNEMNKEEAEYQSIINTINHNFIYINNEVKNKYINEESVDVLGLSYDKDGFEYGYKYNEIEIDKISNISFRIRNIDEITDDKVIATLLFNVDINVIGYYNSYPNIYNPKSIADKHNTNFNCRIELDRINGNIKIFPFKIILNSDSRIIRLEIKEDYYDDELEIINSTRKSRGFIPLDKYNEFLENDLINSEMKQDFGKVFKSMNNIYNSYENVSFAYDTLYYGITSDRKISDKRLISLAKKLKGRLNFPLKESIENITLNDIQLVNKWAYENIERTTNLLDSYCSSEDIYYGTSITFIDSNENNYSLEFSELSKELSEGDIEIIDISLYLNNNLISHGFVKITVGYLHFDDSDNVMDGINDDIEYNYEDIINTLNNIIDKLSSNLKEEEIVADIITKVFDDE